MSPKRLKHKALVMLADLESQRLEVVLIPSRIWDCAMRGGKIRCVQEKNCAWYQKFCEQFSARRTRPRQKRKFDTLIKRRETVWGLEAIIDGQVNGLYVGRLIDFIESEQQARIRNYLMSRKERYEYAA